MNVCIERNRVFSEFFIVIHRIQPHETYADRNVPNQILVEICNSFLVSNMSAESSVKPSLDIRQTLLDVSANFPGVWDKSSGPVSRLCVEVAQSHCMSQLGLCKSTLNDVVSSMWHFHHRIDPHALKPSYCGHVLQARHLIEGKALIGTHPTTLPPTAMPPLVSSSAADEPQIHTVSMLF